MNSLEIFAGVGGLGMGVQRAGFKQTLAVEKNKKCCDTIIANQKLVKELSDWSVVNDDVERINFNTYESKIDLVTGGPPCQPFSLGGKHKADLDNRDCFPLAVRAVNQIKPKAFLFENVKGLVRTNFNNYFEYIRLQLSLPEIKKKNGESWESHMRKLEAAFTKGVSCGLRYNVLSKVLNAADFGISQKRCRVFIVGIRSDLGIEWNFPSPTHSYEALIWSQVNGTYWDTHRVPKKERQLSHNAVNFAKTSNTLPFELPWRTVRDAFVDLPDPEFEPNKSLSFQNHYFHPGAKLYLGHTGSKLDEPAKTLKAGVHGVPGGENMIKRVDGSVRYFSVRESARLQSFPDQYSFNCSWSQSMYQLGNAVPIELASILASSIKKRLIKKAINR